MKKRPKPDYRYPFGLLNIIDLFGAPRKRTPRKKK